MRTLIKKFLQQPANPLSRLLLVLIIVVFLTAIGLRLFQWIRTDTQTSLLTPADGLVTVERLDALSSFVETQIPEPTETFGSTLHEIGVYTKTTEQFPKNTVSLVYVRDRSRIMEIDLLPSINLAKIQKRYAGYHATTITLDEEREVTLVPTPSIPFCVAPTETQIGHCQISKVLFFEWQNNIVFLSVDDAHLTEGELITIARSMIQ